MDTFYTMFGTYTLSMGLLYMYIYFRKKEPFVKYMCMYWIIYSCNVFLFADGRAGKSAMVFDMHSIFDLFGILSLLYIIISFSGRKSPDMWARFALYLSIWIIVSIKYDFGQIVLYMPVGIYQMVLTGVIVFEIYRYWKTGIIEKSVVASVFFIWGVGKSVISFIYSFEAVADIQYFHAAELFMANVMNLTMLIVYYHNSQDRLEQERNIFKIITENASDVLFLYDPEREGRFTYVSPSVKNMLGVPEVKFYADNKYYKEVVHPQDIGTFEELIDIPENEEKKSRMIRMYHRDCRMLWCDMTTTKISMGSGGSSYIVEGIIRDITPIKEANEQLIASKKSRDVLLSYVSHELKTPITSILGFASALKDNDSIDGKLKSDMLNAIYSKSLTLDRLIFDLGQLSKLETNQFSFEFSLFECHELALVLRNRHFHDGESRGINLDFKWEETVLKGEFVIADLDRLDQVFTNILSNAMRYTDPLNPIMINFDLDKSKKKFIFSLTNYGAIISKEDISHIFDRFYRVKKGQQSASENSSGLGLTISKEMVLAHKGSIDVSSSEVKGTTFTVTLPLFDEKEYR